MCSCGWIAMMVNDRPTPFDYSDVNGFFVRGPDRTLYPIRHCPWCGEPLPKWVGDGTIAPASEYDRIFDTASMIRKPDECFKILGKPDYDQLFPDDKGMPTDLRNIEYCSISDWYTLQFYFQNPDQYRFSINAKPIPLYKNAINQTRPQIGLSHRS